MIKHNVVVIFNVGLITFVMSGYKVKTPNTFYSNTLRLIKPQERRTLSEGITSAVSSPGLIFPLRSYEVRQYSRMSTGLHPKHGSNVKEPSLKYLKA